MTSHAQTTYEKRKPPVALITGITGQDGSYTSPNSCLQQDKPDDYVLATGKSRTLKDLLDVAFGCLGLDWLKHVEVDERFCRVVDPCQLLGDPSRAEQRLGWSRSFEFDALIRLMVESDVELLNRNTDKPGVTTG